MKCKASRKSADDSRLLDGTSKTKRGDNAKEKRTKSSKRSTVSKHFFASRTKSLQSSHSSKNSVLLYKEKSQIAYQNDAEKRQRTESSRDVLQQSSIQIPSAAIGTASTSTVDASETCQSKIQECNLSRKGSSGGTIQDFTGEAAKKGSHTDVTSTNRGDISAKRSDITATRTSFLSKDKSLRKHTQNFVHKSASKSFCSETAFPKDKSTSMSAKKTNIFRKIYSQKYLSSGKKSSYTIVPIQLKKHHFDSKSSIESSKNDDVFVEEHERNVSLSSNTIIPELKTYPEANNFTDENQNAAILEKHIQIHVNSELLIEHVHTSLHQTSIKKDINQTKINLEFEDPQKTDNLLNETNSKEIIKRKISFGNLDQNTLPLKKRKKNEMNTSPAKVVADNIEISNYEMLSDDELINAKRRNWQSISKRMIREKENYKLLMRQREQRRKKRNKKIKEIREKFREYFRDYFDPDTSESEEEREILSNYLKRKRQQSDDSSYNTTEEEIEDIFKRDKKLSHDTSANNLQKNVESAISAKIKSDNLCDSTISTEKYTMHDEEVEDGALICKRGTFVNNSQDNIESKIPGKINSDNSCDSIACTESYYATTDEKVEDEASTCKPGTSVNNSQENTKSEILGKINSDNSCDSIACTESYYATTDEEVEDETSTCKPGTPINNSQENIENAILGEINSDNSCNSSVCTEKYYAMHNATTDKEIEDEAICKRGTPVNNSQENIESTISGEINSDNSCDSSACTEKYYSTHTATTDEEIEDEASICKRGTSVNNSQENIESAISGEINFDNSCDSSASTEKYHATTDEEIEDEASICKRDTSNNLQENIDIIPNEVIPNEVKSYKSCDSTTSTEKYCSMHNATTDKKIEDDASTCKRGTSANNLQENIESAIPAEVKSDNSCDSTTRIEKYYFMHDTTTDEKVENRTTCKCDDTSANNSQGNIENTILAKIKSVDSCDSTACVEKNRAVHDATRTRKIEDGASICKCGTLPNNLQENIESAIPAKEQHVENSSSIVVTENSNKSDARAEHSEDILSTIEMDVGENMSKKNIHLNQNVKKADTTFAKAEEVNMQAVIQNQQEDQEMRNVENVDLVQCENALKMQKRAISNLELSTTSAHESTLCNIDDKDGCDVMQNIKNLLTSNSKITRDVKTPTIDQSSVTTSKLERKSNDNSLDRHLVDNDNNSDIEVEIKIKPKSKSRVLGKEFSLKAPWSAVNTCIKNLHTLKNNPSFLNEFFEMNHETSEKSMHTTTDKNLKSNVSLDDSRNVTAETEEIIYDFSPITKDNVDRSQQQNFQDCSILNEDRNAMDRNQRERDECKQSVEQKIRITKNSLELSEQYACNTSDLGKQLQNASMDDKQKTNEEQKSRDNITLEGARSVAEHNQRKEDKLTLCIEQKKMQMAVENNPELINTSQLISPQSIRPQLISPQSAPLQSIRPQLISPQSAPLQSIRPQLISPQSPQSTCSQLISPQSTSQLISPQSAPLQSIRPQVISPQSTPQSAPLQLIRPQVISPQSTSQLISPQSAPLQSIRPQVISPQSTSQLISPQSIRPQVMSPQSTPQLILPQSAPLQLIRPQVISPQSTSQLISPQSAPLQSIRPQVISPQSTSQLISPQSTRPQVMSPQSTPQLILSQSASLQSIHPQVISPQSTPQSIRPQLISQSAPLQSIHPQVISPQATPQSIRSQLISPQSAPLQSIRPQLISPQSPQSTYPQLVFPQLTSAQSVPKRPFYNPAVKHVYSSPKVNAPIEINRPTVNNEVINLSQIVVKRVCANVAYCRDLIRYKLLNAENVQIMYRSMNEIKQDLEKLRLWLNMDDIECAITYINRYMQLIRPITVRELKNYINIVQTYMVAVQTGSQQYNAKSNASQYPNVGGSVPNVSMPSVNAKSYLGNAPVPDAKMPNHGKFTQSSKIRPTTRPAPIKQQQLSGNLANSPQVPYSRPSMSNIHQQYTCCLPPTTYSYVPNVNQQQSLGNASHPVQSQYMPSTDMWHVGSQPVSVNIGNISSTSTSNTNMHSYGPVNQRNANASLTTNARQLHVASKNTINNTATASAANGQQKQMYFQMSQMNSNTICFPPTTNQNIPLGTCQTVQNDHLPGSFMNTPRTGAVMGNVRHESVNQQQATCNRQVSQAPSEKTQSNCYLDSNKVCYVIPSQPVHCNMQTNPVQNILPVQNMQQKVQNSQCLILPKDISIYPVDLSITSQNVQQNVLNKGAEVPKSQNKNSLQKNASSTNQHRLQDVRQEIPSACNISQNTAPKTSTLQRLNVFQNTMSSRKDKATSILPKSILMPSETNEVIICNFDLAILTDIQKIVLSNQIHSYLFMPQLNKQEFERMRYERRILLHLYQTLYDYIKNIIEKSKTDEKHVEKNSVLQESTIQISINKLTKTQSNENSSACNRNLEKQSSEQSVDINISRNSKSTAIKNNLEARNKESLLTPEFAITKEPLPEDTRLQEQNNTLKTLIQKSSLIDMSLRIQKYHEKESENTEISSPGHSKTSEENSITKVSGKNSETEAEAEGNGKIDNPLKTASSYEKQLPEFSLARNPMNLLRDTLTKEMEDRLEIAKSNVNDISNNVETESVHGTFNVATLKSNRENHATLRSPCNTEDQNKEIYNASNEISNENLQDEMHDVGKNIEILNSTEIQSNPLNISCSSLPSSLNNMLESISPINKCKSTEISEVHTIREKHVETILEFCLNAQQEDFTNEQSNDSIESSGKLIIDESVEKSQEQEQCDKVSSSEEDNLSTSQDSARLFNVIRCKSPEVISLSPLLKNITEAESADICQNFETEAKDTEKLNKESSLEAEEMQLQEISLKLKDTWTMEESTIQSIDTTKEPEDIKEENSKQSLLKVQETQFEKTSLNFEDEWNVEESTIQSIDTSKELENTKEENSEQSLLKVKETQPEETLSDFEDVWTIEEITMQSIDTTKEPEDLREENSERSLLKVEETQLEETSLNFEHTWSVEESTIHSIDTIKELEDTKEENSQQSLLKVEETQLEETSLNFEHTWSVEESTIHSIDTIKEPEDTKEENSQQSLLKVEEMQFEETLLNFEDAWSVEESTIQSIDTSKEPEDTKEENDEQLKVEEQLEETLVNFKHAWTIEEITIQSIDTTKEPEDIREENSERSLLKVEETQLEETSLNFKHAWSVEESTIQSIDTTKEPEDIREENSERSLLKVEETQFEETSLNFEHAWSVEENTIQSIDTTKEPEDIREENSEQSLLKVEETQLKETSLNFEHAWSMEESTIQSIDTTKEPEDIREENSERSLLKVEETQFEETSLNFEHAWSVEENTIQSIDTTKEPEDIREENSEQSLLKVEETQLKETSLNFEHAWSMEESMIQSIDTTKEPEDIREENSERSLLKVEETQFEETSLNFEHAWSVEENTIQSIDTTMEPEDIREENSERSLLKVEEMQFEETSLNFEHAWSVEENTIQSIDTTKEPEDIREENSEQSLLKVEETQLKETSLNFEHAWSVEESTVQSIDTTKEPEDTKEENSEQSLSKVEQLQEMSLKLEVPKDASSMGESTMQSIYLKLPENIEEEIDTHSSVKTISEQLKHVSEHKYYEKPQTFSSNLVRRNDLTAINVKEVTTKNDILNADIVECISVDSDDSEVTIIPNILNIRSISPSLFEKINNTDMILQNDSETSNEKSIANNNLGNSDEVDDMPCLRCKRKSTVYCQACLEAHYCSKRCASLYWNAKHYKQCKGRDSIIDPIT